MTDLPGLLFLALSCPHLTACQIDVTIWRHPAAAALDADVIVDVLLLGMGACEIHRRERLFFVVKRRLQYSQLLAATRVAIGRGPRYSVSRMWSDLASNKDATPADLFSLLHGMLAHGHKDIVFDLIYSHAAESVEVSDMLVLLQALAPVPKPTARTYLPPQATQFTKEEVLGLLKTAMESRDYSFCKATIKLPLTRQLSREDVFTIVDSAASKGHDQLLDCLCCLPGFQQLDGAALVQLLQSALSGPGAKQTGSELLYCRDLGKADDQKL